MRIIVVDVEVFKYDWIAVFLDTITGKFSVFHNDNQAVRNYMSQPDHIYCTFNGKHYDNFCLKAMCCGADPTLIKQISDFIIVDKRNGWDHWFIKRNRFWFDNFDLADDTQQGTSLKHYEAHSFVDIEESEVDFDLDRPLTPEELESTIHYCKWDVWNTARLLTTRKGYLDTKLNVGQMIGLPDEKSLYCTNALLTAKALQAVATDHDDEREYQYPDNLRKDLIPSEVLEFFDRIHDMSIPSEEYFKSSLVINIGDCEVKIGFGGIHAAIPNYIGGDS
jgi:hypothetical protein